MADEIGPKQNWWAEARSYFDDVRMEMKRVTWPNKQEVYGTTVMVILSTFLFALFFWACDQVFSSLVTRVLRWLLHRS